MSYRYVIHNSQKFKACACHKEPLFLPATFIFMGETYCQYCDGKRLGEIEFDEGIKAHQEWGKAYEKKMKLKEAVKEVFIALRWRKPGDEE